MCWWNSWRQKKIMWMISPKLWRWVNCLNIVYQELAWQCRLPALLGSDENSRKLWVCISWGRSDKFGVVPPGPKMDFSKRLKELLRRSFDGIECRYGQIIMIMCFGHNSGQNHVKYAVTYRVQKFFSRFWTWLDPQIKSQPHSHAMNLEPLNEYYLRTTGGVMHSMTNHLSW